MLYKDYYCNYWTGDITTEVPIEPARTALEHEVVYRPPLVATESFCARTVSQESMDDENPALRVSVSNSKGDEDMDEEDALMLERLTGKCSCNVL